MSPPRQVQATVPLVEKDSRQQPLGQELPLIFWKNLSNPSAIQFNDKQYVISADNSYLSALGYLCRNLVITDVQNKNSSERVACSYAQKDELDELSPWYLMRDIKNAEPIPAL